MSWQDRAACRKHPDGDVFFAPDHEVPRAKAVRVGKAKAICATCPVIEECLAYAERHDEDHGIWGGLTENERGRNRNRDGRRDDRPAPTPHGTSTAYRRHYETGDLPVCELCKEFRRQRDRSRPEANAARQRARRARRAAEADQKRKAS